MGTTYSRAEASPAPTVAASAAAAAADAESAPSKTQSTASLTPFTSKILSKDKSESSTTKKGPSGPWWRNFERSELPNPGGYEEISQDAMQILRPNLIEGMQFNFTAPITNTFAMGNSVEMGAKDHPGMFALNANYFTNQIVMMSRTTPADGRVNGRIFINHTPALTSKIIADVGLEPDSSKWSWDLDYRGSDYCGQLKFANGVVAVSYLQSVAPWLAFGGEGFYQHKSCFSAVTWAAKFFTKEDTASLSVSSFGPILANYVHRVNPKVSFATEIFVDARTRDSHLTLGYRFDLKSATVVGHVDSTGRVAATLEEKINPALSLTLSGELDHVKEDYKFGFGVNIGGG
ncbi:translocase MPT family isoform 2 [Gracilaria domingensis]|nr:translocase MPT family isoform 2 [Gracilaria domingensis]